MPPIIQWAKIRSHNGSQELGFEELCAQLFHQEFLMDSKDYERRGTRDAGLECLHLMEDGKQWGMQAKYFTTAPKSSQWQQVRESIKTAIDKNPQLVRLILAFPQDFDDPKIEGQRSAMDKWKAEKKLGEEYAATLGRTIQIDLWGSSHLSERLVADQNRGRLRYFFNTTELSPSWFKNSIDEAESNAGPRYSSELNVELPISNLFEGLCRTSAFRDHCRKLQGNLQRASRRLQLKDFPEALKEQGEEFRRLCISLTTLWQETSFIGIEPLPEIDSQTLSEQIVVLGWDLVEEITKYESENRTAVKEERKRKKEEGYFSYTEKYADSNRAVRDSIKAAAQISEFVGDNQWKLAQKPLLLVVGKPGKGKTHLFVDMARKRSGEGQPAIILLGEQFVNNEPFGQILSLLGLSGEPEEVLHALESAAEASGSRCLLMIDALNEGAGLQLWRKHLAGLFTKLARHPRIAVAVSVRSSYEESVIREELSEGVIRVVHDGFASKPEEAARRFFAYYRINLPGIPLLNPEYTDPLFLKVLCKGLYDQGKHDLPAGYEGISATFRFVIDATESRLRQLGQIDALPGRRVSLEFLQAVASYIVNSEREILSLDAALKLSEGIYPTVGYENSILAQLLHEGLLARELVKGQESDSEPVEVVRFAYQRFGDHLMAANILENSENNPKAALTRIRTEFSESKDIWMKKGLLEALAIQLPEQLGIEIVEAIQLPKDEKSLSAHAENDVTASLIESLLWRKPETITDRTFELLANRIVTKHLQDLYIEAILTMAAIPAHPLNAERLHRMLAKIPLPERDQFWTEWLFENRYDGQAVERLLTWSLMPEDMSHLDDEAVYLACIALGWLTVSVVRSKRDLATKGIVRLCSDRPKIMVRLLSLFMTVDDLYVLERIAASAYGVALKTKRNPELRDLALAANTWIAAESQIEPHLLIQDYCKGIVELAMRTGVVEAQEVPDYWPPHGNDMPPDPPSRQTFEAMLPHRSKWTDRDRVTSHVIDRFGSYDISRTHGGPSFEHIRLSNIPVGQKFEPSPNTVRRQFENKLDPTQLAAWNRFEEAFRGLTYADFPDGDQDGDFKVAFVKLATSPEFEAAEIALLHTLGKPLTKEFLTKVKPTMGQYGSRHEKFDKELFGRYVTDKTLAFGWSADRFADFDSRVVRLRDYSANRPWCDSIGSKYLWMAYYCVYARLADHYYVIPELYEDPEHYRGTWQVSERTVDPSVVPSEFSENNNWAIPALLSPDCSFDERAWVSTDEGVSSPLDHLKLTDVEGIEWIALQSWRNWDMPLKPEQHRDTASRPHMWLQLHGYVVQSTDFEKASAWFRKQRFMGRWMPEGKFESYDIFLGELYDSPAWEDYKSGDWEYQEWQQPNEEVDFSIAHLAEQYKLGDDDTSAGDESLRIIIPSPYLQRSLQIEWSGKGPEWLDSANLLQMFDPAPLAREGALLVCRKQTLDEFLARNGLCVIWTILGERLVYNWDRNYPKMVINGVAWYQSHNLEFAMSNYFDGRGAEDDEADS